MSTTLEADGVVETSDAEAIVGASDCKAALSVALAVATESVPLPVPAIPAASDPPMVTVNVCVSVTVTNPLSSKPVGSAKVVVAEKADVDVFVAIDRADVDVPVAIARVEEDDSDAVGEKVLAVEMAEERPVGEEPAEVNEIMVAGAEAVVTAIVLVTETELEIAEVDASVAEAILVDTSTEDRVKVCSWRRRRVSEAALMVAEDAVSEAETALLDAALAVPLAIPDAALEDVSPFAPSSPPSQSSPLPSSPAMPPSTPA